jgi:heat shock protein HslJ
MDLIGGVWTWQETVLRNGETFVPSVPGHYTVEFEIGGRVTGRADCNRLFGPYTATQDSLEIGPLAMTRMACPPGSLGERFAMQLDQVTAYALRDGALFLELRAESGRMRLTR